jgi:hypothetical protein
MDSMPLMTSHEGRSRHDGAASVDQGRRAITAVAVAAVPPAGISPELAASLEARGWRSEALPVGVPPDPRRHALAVVEALSHPLAALTQAELWRARTPELRIVLRIPGDADEDLLACASRLTPYLFADCLPAGVVAACIVAIGGVAPDLARADDRRVTIRPWDSIEVDGRALYLGAAERNFLFTLAQSREARLWKHDDVDCGAGRALPASDCRRRLGERLGPELTTLLIAAERGEPYRLRTPEDVAAASREDAGRHPPTALRIVGRSQVALAYRGLLGSVA